MQAIESLLQNCQVKLPLTEWSCVVVLASCPAWLRLRFHYTL
jgi:hypothetical protein